MTQVKSVAFAETMLEGGAGAASGEAKKRLSPWLVIGGLVLLGAVIAAGAVMFGN